MGRFALGAGRPDYRDHVQSGLSARHVSLSLNTVPYRAPPEALIASGGLELASLKNIPSR
jgi:hypothetical protein